MTIPELEARRVDPTLSNAQRLNAAWDEVTARLKLSGYALAGFVALRKLLEAVELKVGRDTIGFVADDIAVARAALAPVEHLLPKE